MVAKTQIPLPSRWSDGDSEHWPKKAAYLHQPSDRVYHEKLADLWMAHTNQAVNGIKYTFTELPANYRIFTKARRTGNIVDRYIFGQAKGRFDSPNKFFEHFKYMMKGGIGQCACINCSAVTATRKTTQASMTGTFRTMTKLEDAFSSQLKKYVKLCLESPNIKIDRAWQGAGPPELERHSFREISGKYRESPSFLPRKGELVLFYSDDQPNGRFEEITRHFKLYDETTGRFLGFPQWRAGVVTEEPQAQLGIGDLSMRRSRGEGYHGYRIELYPDPDGVDKTLSSQAYKAPLSHIRPLNMFHEVLSGLPQNKWHETIHNALKVMNSTSLVDPIRFQGQWPWARIECGGIWIGPELFVLGDAVRLMRQEGNEDDPIDTALIIDRIDWKFDRLDIAEESSSIVVRGKAYTTNKDGALCRTPVTGKDENESNQGRLPSSFKGYTWYTMSKVEDSCIKHHVTISHSMIIGRLYESDAMKKLLDVADFDVSHLGINQARHWARHKNNYRNPNTEGGWRLTNDHIEALAIESMNGFAVGKGRDREKLLAKKDYDSYASEDNSFSGKHKRQGLMNGKTRTRVIDEQGKGIVDGLETGSERDSKVKENKGGAIEYDEDVEDDEDSTRPRSYKSILTDRTPDWSENEDEDPDAFISEILASNGLPPGAGERDGDDRVEGRDGDERPPKRLRL